jgi:hypothetical protein
MSRVMVVLLGLSFLLVSGCGPNNTTTQTPENLPYKEPGPEY